MAYDENLKSVSYDADSSLAVWTSVPGQPGSAPSPNHGGKQYHFVKITGNHTVGLAGAGDTPVGVMQNKPQVTGQAATVGIFGVSRVIAGETLAAGDKVSVNATGKAVKQSGSAPVAGTVVLGAGVGEIASVQLSLG